MTLKDAIETLSTTHQSLDLVAQGCVVDAAEVDAALKAAEPDTVEAVCLQVLAKHHPYIPKPKTKTE
jgi:NACalpha-BTF3-like transcription factor